MICKLCGSRKTKYLFKGYDSHGRHIIDKNSYYKLFRCKNCEAIFSDNIIINDAYYQKHYNLDYYEENKKNTSLYRLLCFLFIKFFAKKKDKNILNFFNTNNKLSILDVGCGEGSFLSSLDKKIFDAYGIEINPEGIKICQKKNLKIYNQDILKIDFAEKKFNIITLWHVLEHIDNPTQVFNKMNKILDKNGVLIISTPNTDGFGFLFGKEKWFHLDQPRHLILYNEKSLKKLLQLSNFKIIKIQSDFYEFPLDLFWSLKKNSLHYLLLPFYLLLKIIKPETLTIICKKI